VVQNLVVRGDRLTPRKSFRFFVFMVRSSFEAALNSTGSPEIERPKHYDLQFFGFIFNFCFDLHLDCIFCSDFLFLCK
jgi:hypothetical protein